jgi:hypothetical protein
VSTKPLITEETAAFLESGLAITVATRDGDLQPDGAWAWAVRVHDDGTHLTVFLHEQAAAAMLRNLESHPEIALVLDRPTTHRACQLKGTFVASRKVRAADRAEVERQVVALRSDLESIGIPPAMTAAWKYWPCAALSVRVARLFEQTPGPGAGEPMA